MSVTMKTAFKSSDGESFEMEEHQSPTTTHPSHQSPTTTHSGFTKSVNRTLLASQTDSVIKKLSIKYNIDKEIELAYVCPWISNAVERNVSELDLSINPKYEQSLPSEKGFWEQPRKIILPSELFTSKALVKLTLGTRVTLGELPKDVSLPALKTLVIDTVYFHDDDVGGNRLLPRCPVLEEFCVRHVDYHGMPLWVSSDTIKKLSVHYDCESDRKEIGYGYGVLLQAPSLVSLDYSNYALSGDMVVHNLESLVEVRLDLRYAKKTKRLEITDLLTGICNVENLDITPNSADVIARCVKHGLVLPLFHNLVHLSFGSKNTRGWKLLPDMLNKSPKLQTLTIKDLDGYTADDASISPSKVKALRILGYRGYAQELEQLKSFIGKFKYLEKVHVDITEEDDDIISQARKYLMMLPRVSVTSKCHII